MMPTDELLLTVFSRELGGKDHRTRVSLIGAIAAVLRAAPRIYHLNDDTFERCLHRWKVRELSPSTTRKYVNGFQSLWRRAIERGLAQPGKASQRKPGTGHFARVKLDGSEGTLWHLCETRFFPANLDIRSRLTRHQYKIAIASLKKFIGREPTLADLDDDLLLTWMTALRDDHNLAPKTVNERAGRIKCLWTWCAKKRLVEQFPFVGRFKCPKRVPRAWTADQLRALFAACKATPGCIGRIPAADWWLGLHLVLWDSGARVSEILAAEWAWFDWDSRVLSIPAEVRKGAERDMAYTLHADTVEVLCKIRSEQSPMRPERFIFQWPHDRTFLWIRYKDVLRLAGLPCERGDMFHKMRRSVASHLEAAGHNACTVLQHSTPAVTIASYLDPTIVKASRPAEVLFRPNAKGGVV